MLYTNSPLVDYIKISPNRTSPRNHAIDTITIHCTAGQVSVERLGEMFADPNRKASSNYGIGPDGRIGLYVEEKDRSWCSSNAANDHRAITIEVSSESVHPYKVTDAAYQSLIKLLVDICKRNGIPELRWKADKNLIDQPDLQNMTVHRWFAAKACPGDFLYERHGEIAAEVNRRLKAETTTPANDWLDNKPDKYAQVAVDWAVKNGIMRGNDKGDLMLHSPITRQDMLVILERFYNLIKNGK